MNTGTNIDIDLVLLQDLGREYNPQKAIEFLQLLKEKYKDFPEKKNIEKILENPPKEDTTLHVIYKTPFILGEIVLAGKTTRETFPIINKFPVHFKKTILPSYGSITVKGSDANPQKEKEISKIVWDHFQEIDKNTLIPRPLGHSRSTYRSELIEAKTLGAITPINNSNDPKDIAEQIQEAKLSHTTSELKELWDGLEKLNEEIGKLHSGGLLHNDLHRENMMLVRTEKETIATLIDFETTEEDERFQTPEWEGACKEDKNLFLEECSIIALCIPKELINKTNLYKEVEKYSNVKINNIRQILRDKSKTSPDMSI